jgi:transcriptional regulator with XRE-family HTH domain
MEQFIGNNIKHIRLLKNLSQEYVAEKLEISPATFSKIENNKQAINDNQLIALAKVFDVSVDWLTNFSAQQIFENVSNSLFYGTNSTQNNHINEELIQALTLQLKEKDEQIKHLMQQLSKKDEVIYTLRKQF